MKFLDLFAGIGGFRLALEQAGHKCIGFCEIDKFARQTYKANFDTEGEVEWHDITTVADEAIRGIGHVDIITGGFPCQSFSVAGKRGGFEDTRGTLFFEIARIAKEVQPRYLLLENVKGLLSHSSGRTFGIILNTLDELGFDCEWQLLNSKNFGVPQNRERVFIIGHSRRFPRREVFPIKGENGKNLRKIVGGSQGNTLYDASGISATIAAQTGGLGGSGGGIYAVPDIKCINQYDENGKQRKQPERVYSAEGNMTALCSQMGGRFNVAIPVLTPDREEKRQNGRRFKEPGEPMFTLTAQDKHGVVVLNKKGEIKRNNTNNQYASTLTGGGNSGGNHSDMDLIVDKPAHIPGPEDINNTVRSGGRGSLTAKHNHDTIHDGVRIRRLTPLETFRLQGFPDSHHDKAKAAGVSDSQLYKQAGNAVTVNVVYEIAKRLGDEKRS